MGAVIAPILDISRRTKKSRKQPKKFLVCGLAFRAQNPVFRAQNPETDLQFGRETTIIPLSLCSPADGFPIFQGQNARYVHKGVRR